MFVDILYCNLYDSKTRRKRLEFVAVKCYNKMNY